MRLFSLILLLLILPLRTTSSQSDGIHEARYARLGRGINLAYWFWYAQDDLSAVANYYTPEDLTLIHDLGFTFVRLPIDWQFVYDPASPNLLSGERLPYLDRALEQILAADLAVIVDLHSLTLEEADTSLYSGALESDPQVVVEFTNFWHFFAQHLSQYDPEWVFLSIMNEPVFEDNPSAWQPIQAQLAAVIRQAAPDHTIIATSAYWSSFQTLPQLEPLDDPNVVYDFHFYEPFFFTHQGADWGWEAVIPMRDVPYPSTPENVQPAIDRLSDPQLQAYLRDYGAAQMNQAALAELLAPVARWAQENGVRVICGEFGVYKCYADPQDRAQWLYDVRSTLEGFGIGWAMWEYDGSFGLVIRLNNRVIVDRAVAAALGLE